MVRLFSLMDYFLISKSKIEKSKINKEYQLIVKELI